MAQEYLINNGNRVSYLKIKSTYRIKSYLTESFKNIIFVYVFTPHLLKIMVEITGSTSIPANHPFLFFSLGSSHLVPVGWSHHWQQKRSSAIQHKSHIPTSVTVQGIWTKLVQAELNAWQLFSDWGNLFSPWWYGTLVWHMALLQLSGRGLKQGADPQKSSDQPSITVSQACPFSGHFKYVSQ